MKDETDRACSTSGEKINIYRALLGRPEERRLLDKPYAQMGVILLKVVLKEYDRLMQTRI
jgi:hypothetical protein